MNTQKKRAKKSILHALITDRAELESAASRAKAAQLKRDGLIIARDLALAELAESYNTQINVEDETLEELVARMESWCRRNRTAFGEKKTLKLGAGELAFRDSPGKVETLRGVTQADVIEALCALADEEWADQFLHIKTTLDKSTILKKWDAEKDALNALGLNVEKGELFSFTPDREAIATPRESTATVAAA